MVLHLYGFITGLFGLNPAPVNPPEPPPAPVAAPIVASSPDQGETPKRPRRSSDINARYDAAQTTPGLQNHWAMADGLSADAANSPTVRKTLRERSRLECGNNANACGIVRTLGNDVVGTGPRVQCLIPGDPTSNRIIQQAFAEWAKQVRFAKKLRMMRQTKSRDGEVFAMLTFNPKIKHVVKLDFKPIECDQITNPYWTGYELDEIDGIRFDDYGNVTEYCMLRYHPGSVGIGPVNTFDLDWIPAHSMIHLFLLERPGQHRGVPEMTSSLSLFAMVRNFSVATLDAARFAASPIGVVYSEHAVDDDDEDEEAADPFAPLASFQVPQGCLTSIGNGNRLEQIKPEHPTSTHNDYTTNLLTTAARPVSMSRNIATGDSSGYNFSSARLDRSLYYKSIGIDQADLEIECIDVVFDAFWEEFRLGDDTGLPPEVLDMETIPHECHWDQPAETDPQGASEARKTNLMVGMTSFQSEYAAIGLDAETEMRKQAEILNLDYEVYVQKLTDALFAETDSAAAVPVNEADTPMQPETTTDPAVQDTALNGAQIRDGLLTIVDKVVNGQIPLAAGLAIIKISFPTAPVDLVQEVLSALSGFVPKTLSDGSPNPAASPEPAQATGAVPTASAGVFAGKKHRDFSNNLKQINAVVKGFIEKQASEALTRVSLQRLGLSPEEIDTVIDDVRDGSVDDPSLQEGEANAS